MVALGSILVKEAEGSELVTLPYTPLSRLPLPTAFPLSLGRGTIPLSLLACSGPGWGVGVDFLEVFLMAFGIWG